MLQPVHHSPAVPAASTSRGVAVRSNADSALRPHAVTNAAADASVILKCGMPCYGEHAPPGIGNVLSAPERFVIEADYRRHRGYLNNPEYLFNLDAGKVPAHAAYRVLCTQFQRPGSFAIRQAEQGAFMLVHRSQRTPQLVVPRWSTLTGVGICTSPTPRAAAGTACAAGTSRRWTP